MRFYGFLSRTIFATSFSQQSFGAALGDSFRRIPGEGRNPGDSRSTWTHPVAVAHKVEPVMQRIATVKHMTKRSQGSRNPVHQIK